MAVATTTALLIGGAVAAGGAKVHQDIKQKTKRKEAEAQAAQSQARAAKSQRETTGLKASEAQRKSLLRQRSETIQTSPLGVSGSVDTTTKKTLLGT
jgi:hypothetical protein